MHCAKLICVESNPASNNLENEQGLPMQTACPMGKRLQDDHTCWI